jgi:hypothetical protein
MYEAEITSQYGGSRLAILGPTDSRDEAARLARAWIESHRPVRPGDAPSSVGAVEIRRVEDTDDGE